MGNAFSKFNDGDIIVGRPIEQNAFDKDGILLLRKGQVVESERQLQTLIGRGLFYIEGSVQYNEPVRVSEVKGSTFQVLDNIQDNLGRLFVNVMAGATGGFRNNMLVIRQMLMDACNMDQDAAIGYIFLGKKNRYTVKHPIDIAIMCEIVAKEMKWPENERLSLLAAALTANTGMLSLQERLYIQTDPLTYEQKEAIREHPEYGAELLSSCDVTDKIWLYGVLHHHEAMDGSGYPSGLKAENISMSARMIAVGDRYCAAVSGRQYRKSLMPHEAMREIFLTAGKDIDTEIVKLCVKLTGIYPPGIFVRLVNSEIAVVTHRGVKAHLPIVRSVVNANGSMFLNPVERDCSKGEFAIKEIFVSEENRIDINPYKLWDMKGNGSAG